VQLDVRRSPSLVAAIQVMVTMPREAAKATRKYSKAVIQPEWKKGLADNAPAARMFQTRLVRPSAVYISDTGVKLVAGKGDLVRQTEFGATRDAYRDYRRKSKHGGSHHVHRRTQRQFYPNNKKGYVVYPTASDMIPRIAALWVQTIYRTVAEVIEKQIHG
jgi:hypothetical protein